MSDSRMEDIDRGRQRVPQISKIMPDHADERIRRIYDDIRATLRVPFVNFIFRTLANYPDYFGTAWAAVSPNLRTQTFEQAADTLRAQALIEPVPNTAQIDWESLGDMKQIRPFTDSIHYVLPKLLLIATIWDVALLEPAEAETQSKQCREASVDENRIVAGQENTFAYNA